MPESYECYDDATREKLEKLPEIEASNQDLTYLAKQAWDAVAKQNENEQTLFRVNDRPVRLKDTDAGIKTWCEITPDMLRTECDRAAVWFVWKGNKKYQSNPRPELMRFMLSMPEIHLPRLNKIITAPAYYKHPHYNQISLHDKQGYNQYSRIYLDMDMNPPPFVLENPRPEQIEQAKELIEDFLHDFPFAHESDRVNAIGLMLLPFVRDIIKGATPLHLIEAPVPGSGKNLLLDVLITPGLGKNYKLIAEGRDDDEYRKRITSALCGKVGAIIIDNVAESIASGPLASAITADIWTDRILGKTEDISIQVRTIWIATANNPILSMEIARRTIRIRLSPLVDQPWMREGFRHDNLREYAKTHRAKIAEACLVLCQSWVWAGCPLYKGRPLGGFENWSRVIGGILEYADYEGFLSMQSELYETADTDNEVWRCFVDEWHNIYGSNTVGVSDLFRIADQIEGFEMRGKEEAGKRRALGRALKNRRDRVYNGFMIKEAHKMGKLAQWQLIIMDSKETEKESFSVDGEEPPDYDWAPEPEQEEGELWNE
jgi:hypothetical protein